MSVHLTPSVPQSCEEDVCAVIREQFTCALRFMCDGDAAWSGGDMGMRF